MLHNPNPVKTTGKFEPGTVVRLKKTGEFALIHERVCLMKRPENFLHYMGIIEGRGPKPVWALYDDDLELECLPDGKALH